MPTIEVEIDSDIIQSSTSQFSETNDDDGVYWQNKKNRMMDMEVHVLGEEVAATYVLVTKSFFSDTYITVVVQIRWIYINACFVSQDCDASMMHLLVCVTPAK
ncbi:unnamed protein product [Arctia plantaginis]|uniref:Uncharacterized protein n=1 Tax=Arctia plantaginis TaxID=874455 RepID=A0A8S1AWN7_ARCPL|nr:unnamed protein product [Arctia plantaginis]